MPRGLPDDLIEAMVRAVMEPLDIETLMAEPIASAVVALASA